MEHRKKGHPIVEKNDIHFDIFLWLMLLLAIMLFTAGVTIISWYVLKMFIATCMFIYSTISVTLAIL